MAQATGKRESEKKLEMVAPGISGLKLKYRKPQRQQKAAGTWLRNTRSYCENNGQG
jgi:hypothetical protein